MEKKGKMIKEPDLADILQYANEVRSVHQNQIAAIELILENLGLGVLR